MKGVIVCPEPMAAEIGADVLRRGGNAFDAAVAAGFAQTVFNPFQCGLGGWGSATVYRAATGTAEHFGFWPRIGSKMRPDMWAKDIKGYTNVWHYALFNDNRNMKGYTSIMTPGTVAGFGEIHSSYGTLPWADLLRPSIEWSDRGFPIPEYIAAYTRAPYLPDLMHPRDKYCATPAAKQLWLRPDGSMKERGELYRNPDQARTLERLARFGPGEFYTGELSELIISDFEANGAFVTREDLHHYRVRRSEPLRGGYRGYDLVSSALPGGGLLLLQALQALEHFDFTGMEHNGPEHGAIIAGVLAWTAVTRFRHLTDPEFGEVPVDRLLSREHAAEIAGLVRKGEFPTQEVLNAPGGTTHLCVMDEEGNCVSMTHTLTSCSGVVVPGTGFTWNDGVSLMDPVPGRPNSLVPGRARASAVAPTIVLQNGRPVVVLGAPGGWSISSGLIQTIVNLVDYGMSPLEAVCAPRFHSEGSPVFCEGRMPQATVRSLRRQGLSVDQSLYNYHASFSRPQCIVAEGGCFRAASDPRSDGGTAIYVR